MMQQRIIVLTIPAKYTLTEAHFIIVELEKELEALQNKIKELEKNIMWPESKAEDNPAGSLGMP